MLRQFESKIRDETSKTGSDARKNTFIAFITDNEVMGGGALVYRWKYAWVEVIVNDVEEDAPEFEVRTGGRSGGFADDAITYALNGCEASNTDEDVAPAVVVDAPYYPADFSPMAIGQLASDPDDRLNVAVLMHQLSDAEGNKSYVFSMANSHDGTCTV